MTLKALVLAGGRGTRFIPLLALLTLDFAFFANPTACAGEDLSSIVTIDKFNAEFPSRCQDLRLYCKPMTAPDASLKITETKEIGGGLRLIIGIVDAPSLNRAYSFYGAYDAGRTQFNFLGWTSELKPYIRMEQLTKSEQPFLFVDPVFDKFYDFEKVLQIYRYSQKGRQYQPFLSIPVFQHVQADSADGSEDYIDNSVITLGSLDSTDRREVIVKTARKINTSTDDAYNIKEKTETYGWHHDRLCVVERIVDGKKEFGRSDPFCEIQELRKDDQEAAWIRLVDLLDYPNPSIASEAYVAANAKMAGAFLAHEKLSDAFSHALVNKYIATKGKEEQRAVATLLYTKAFNDRTHQFTEQDLKELKNTIPHSPPYDVTLLNTLAAAGEASVWPPLLQTLKEGLKSNNGCEADTSLTGIGILAKKLPISKEDAEAIAEAARSNLACSDASVSESASSILSK